VAPRRRSEPAPEPEDHPWFFVTNHLLVLLQIASDPEIRMAEMAAHLGITERSVQKVVADLEKAGYLTRTRVGRRNHYEIAVDMPLRHLETQHRALGDLLQMLAR